MAEQPNPLYTLTPEQMAMLYISERLHEHDDELRALKATVEQLQRQNAALEAELKRRGER